MRAAPRAARVIAVGVLSSIALLPFLPLLVRAMPVLAPLEHVANLWFDFHCERDPLRTPELLGSRLAVCARCAGIYLGLGLGALVRWPRLSPALLRAWVLAAAALMLTDMALERGGVHGPWMSARIATGLLLAYPVGVGLALAASRAPSAAQSP